MEKKVSGKHSSMNGFAMMKGRVATVVLASALLLGGGLTAQAQNAALTTCSQSAATAIPQNPNWKANAAEWQKLKGEITLYMTNDMGRNGYYDQKPIAELMGEMAGTVDPECVLAVGDIHHFNGVASPQDPLWLTNYEYEPTLKSKACLKCLYFTIIIFDLCRYLEYFSYLCTINQTE